MSAETCQVALNAIIMGLMTWFWLWYLTWEAKHFSGKQPTRWYERPITEIFSQLVNFLRRTK